MSSVFKLGRASRDVWTSRAALSADKPFLHFQDRSWTYGAADIEIRRYAAGLFALGVRQGDLVVVGMTNRPETLFIQFAVRHLGGVMVGMVPGCTYDEMAYQLDHCQAGYFIADDPIASVIAPRRGDFPYLKKLVLDSVERMPLDAINLAAIHADTPIGPVTLNGYDDLSPAEILYTSGSTSKPKGVVLPAGALVTSGFGYADRFEFVEEDHFLLPFTFAHGTGALLAPGMVLKEGSQLTLLEKLSPSRFWGQVEESGATAVLLFPAQINLLMNAPNAPKKGESTLRIVITHEWMGDFWERFGIPMGMTWGSTETGATGAGSEPGYRGDKGQGYLGKPYAEAEIAAFDPDGRRLPAGQPGELRLKHRHIMRKYLNAPDLTAQAVVDGWVLTGDLGMVNAEGCVWYEGRLKNMIKRSGENISPAEVEVVINDHPAVSECMVFGVPDVIRKEEVALVVSVDEGQSLDPAELIAFASEKLARAKLPRFVQVVFGPLPRLSVGKLDRNRVAQTFDTASAWDGRAQATSKASN